MNKSAASKEGRKRKKEPKKRRKTWGHIEGEDGNCLHWAQRPDQKKEGINQNCFERSEKES